MNSIGSNYQNDFVSARHRQRLTLKRHEKQKSFNAEKWVISPIIESGGKKLSELLITLFMLFFHTLAKWLRNSMRNGHRVCLWWELASLMMTLGRNRSVLIIEKLFGNFYPASTRSRFHQIKFGMLAQALGISSRRVVILPPFRRVICCKFSNWTSGKRFRLFRQRASFEKSSN